MAPSHPARLADNGREFARLRSELEEARQARRRLEEELDGANFNPESKTGRMLVARNRALLVRARTHPTHAHIRVMLLCACAGGRAGGGGEREGEALHHAQSQAPCPQALYVRAEEYLGGTGCGRSRAMCPPGHT